MAGVEITVGVEGSADLKGALDPDHALEVRIEKSPGACRACVANNDPARVPVHSRPPCRCEVVFVNV